MKVRAADAIRSRPFAACPGRCVPMPENRALRDETANWTEPFEGVFRCRRQRRDPMSSLSFSSVPSVVPHTATPAGTSAVHPLRAVLITAFADKLIVAGILLACVSLAPPNEAEDRYLAALN